MVSHKRRECFRERIRPSFDRLECRLVLSGSSLVPLFVDTSGQLGVSTASGSLKVLSTSPAPSSVLSSSPSTMTVTFDRPLSSFSLGIADFELFHVASDGSTTPLGVGESKINESLDSSDPSGSRILLTLTKPLVGGRYRLVLRGGSFLEGEDGSSLATNGSDLALSNFDVDLTTGGITTATDLQTVGTTVMVHDGVLDLQGNPGAVNYYRVELAPGHHWRLGASIMAQSEGSPLTSTLSLFDSSGRLISTSSTGLISSPGDPFLFQGLDPGTFYLGVSARGNIPGPDGTYNLGDSILPAAGLGSPGGSFQLDLVADPADQPTQVLGVRLDHADPLSSDITGFTIQFSGPLALAGIDKPTQNALKLIDESGESWSLTPVNYNPTLGQLSFVFNQALPQGSYSLELTGNGELIDLAGMVPVTAGQPAGILGSIILPPSNGTPDDLGPLYPDLASAGLKKTVNVDANASTTLTFVVLSPGVYAVEGIGPANGFTLGVLDAEGNPLAAAITTSPLGETDLLLKAGLYSLVISNQGSDSVDLPFTLREKQIVFSDLLEGGVAQGAALNLRLVSPQANFGAITTSSLSSNDPTTAVVSTQPLSKSTLDNSSASTTGIGASSDSSRSLTVEVGVATPSGPSVVGLFYSTSVVGSTSLQSGQINVVGSTVPTGTMSLASNNPGLSSGLIAIPGNVGREKSEVPKSTPIGTDERLVGAPHTSGTETGLLARPSQSQIADEISIANAEWVGRFLSDLVGWFDPSDRSTMEPPIVRLSNQEGSSGSSGSADPIEPTVQKPSVFLGPSIAMGAALAAIVYRYRKPCLMRSHERAQAKSKENANHPSILLGPHRREGIRVR